MKTLQEILPNFYKELQTSLKLMGRNEIVQQLPKLTIERHTLDKTKSAMYLYTGGLSKLNKIEKTAIGIKHGESLELNAIPGTVILDLDNFNRVTGIEILDRTEVISIIARNADSNS